ncbi:MAG TPA: EAL domain-containing protein [Usitatibacteraceae bacterium]
MDESSQIVQLDLSATNFFKAYNFPLTPGDTLVAEGDSFIGNYAGLKIASAFQPLVSMTHSRVVAFEALARPRDGVGNAITPERLFSEEFSALDLIRLDQLAREVHVMNFGAQVRGPEWLFLNTTPDIFVRLIEGVPFEKLFPELDQLSDARVVLELTEHACIDEPKMREVIIAHRNDRYLIAIDDFGAQQSNYDRVEALRPEFVKLDRSLIKRSGEDPVTRRVLKSIVSTIHQMGAMVVAEGLETTEEVLASMEADVDFFQGFWFAEPAPKLAASARAVTPFIEFIWTEFTRRASGAEQREQDMLIPIRNAIDGAARIFADTQNLAGAAAAFLAAPGALRVFLLNADGIQQGSSITGGQSTGAKLAPLFPDAGANWSRRSYFNKALQAPGRPAFSGMHFSVAAGRDCMTAGLAVSRENATFVLCFDFQLLH